jgi:hypothetical protein
MVPRKVPLFGTGLVRLVRICMCVPKTSWTKCYMRFWGRAADTHTFRPRRYQHVRVRRRFVIRIPIAVEGFDGSYADVECTRIAVPCSPDVEWHKESFELGLIQFNITNFVRLAPSSHREHSRSIAICGGNPAGIDETINAPISAMSHD